MTPEHSHASHQHVKFCIQCGTGLETEAGTASRLRCPACGWIAHLDPKVAAGSLVLRHDRLLLVRRRFEPERGRWSLPGGFVNSGEDPGQTAVRECQEETGVRIACEKLLRLLIGQAQTGGADLFLLYQGRWLAGEPRPSDDVDGAAFFASDQLPALAFESTQWAVRHWLGQA